MGGTAILDPIDGVWGLGYEHGGASTGHWDARHWKRVLWPSDHYMHFWFVRPAHFILEVLPDQTNAYEDYYLDHICVPPLMASRLRRYL